MVFGWIFLFNKQWRVNAMKPNIILITTDQQRFDTIQALGNRHIYTPHLNWLVDTGITFSRCYTDSPICMAARATIMTGKNGYSTGLVGNQTDIVPMAKHPTLPGVLTTHGYQTRAQGKMHFHPIRANYGFEHMEIPMDYYRERNRNADHGLPKEHGVGENEIEPVISTVNEVNSLTYWTVRRSIDFLETRDETRPFFLWTSFTKPHPPFDPCFNYWTLYQNKSLPEPVLGDWSETLDQIAQGFLHPTYVLNNAYRLSNEQLMDVKRAYYACITQIDYSLGLLFARLRELGLFENTWILFTSDHGDMMGDHHLGAKSVFFEGSAHVPFLIKPPSGLMTDRYAGMKCDSLVQLADIMPTVLGMAGIEGQEGMDGDNVLDLITNPKERIFYGNSGHQFFTVIEGPYKYLWTSLGGAELMFDLEHDPYEQVNLAACDEHRDKLLLMRGKLVEHLRQYDSKWLSGDQLIHDDAPKGPQDVRKWPGFHSTIVPTDVLH
jgi:arylsulfatase